MKTQLFVCGSGECEQLGLPDCFLAKRPRPLLLPQPISMVACGEMHTLAVSSTGIVFSWGCNDDGALGREGAENEPLAIPNLQPINLISAGDSHSVAYASQARVLYNWGKYRNREGNMSKGHLEPTQIGKAALRRHKPITKLLSGANHTLVLVDSKVYAWGDSIDGQICRLPKSRNRIQHSLEMESTGLKNVVDIYTGKYHSFALTKDGSFFGWGLNNFGQLGDGTEDFSYVPHKIPSLGSLGVVDITGGVNHSVALTDSGTIFAWGRNDDFQLGLNHTNTIHTPQQVLGLSKVTGIASGSHFNYAVANKLVYSWGFGYSFVLLNGKEYVVSMPSLVAWSVGKDLNAVHAGSQHAIIVRYLEPCTLESGPFKRKHTSPSRPNKRVKKACI